MGLRSRLKSLVKEQVRQGLERFVPGSLGGDVRDRNVQDRSVQDRGTPGGFDGPASAPVGRATVPPSPAERTVIRPPRLAQDEDVAAAPTDGRVRIRVQPSRDTRHCVLQLSEPILPGFSRWWERPEPTDLPPLIAALVALEGVVSVHVDDANVTLVRGGVKVDWKPLSEQAGELIRQHLSGDEPLLSAEELAEIPGEDAIRSALQTVLDDEVNPGVAAHSGHIALERIRGNSVWVRMGGGCQGCSAADLTLRRGVHLAFRKAVPNLGAIYDATDHAAGANPWFG